jgi:hypothetical protein
MIFSLTIFILSCLGMLSMILVKLFELKTGRDFIFIRWRNKIDKFAHLWYSKTKIFIVSKEHSSIAFIKNIPVKILHLVSVVHVYLYKRYGKHVDMIKGRSVPTNKGQVSFFVNSISEYKKEIKR